MKSIGCYLRALWQKVIGESFTLAPTPPPAEVSHAEQPSREAVQPVTADADPLSNTAWVKLAEAGVELFAELDRYLADFDPPRREVAEHVCGRLMEILARNGVGLINEDGAFDRNLHELNNPPSIAPPSGAATVHIISPGFHIGRRVLRRARVEIL